MRCSITRRSFLWLSTAAATQASRGQQPSLAHTNVADLDRATILSQASAAMGALVRPPRAAQFFTETEPFVATAGGASAPKLQRADAVALRQLSATIAALSAGFLVTKDPGFATQATAHVQPWFVNAATRLDPAFDQAGCAPGTRTGTPAGVVDLVPLAEIARALSFLTDTLEPANLDALKTWFTATNTWLSENKQAFIAREAKDHRASAHLLLASAVSRFIQDENTLEDCRKRFRTHTLRNQIRPDGVFPQEVATPNPYRNTLFNFDLLAGACQLLSSQFDLLWEFELIDGVSLRTAAAYLYPAIAHPELWSFPADVAHFRELPGGRPGMLFAGRAYNRPEYVQTWLAAAAATPSEDVAYSYPIRQPALWTARAPHGL